MNLELSDEQQLLRRSAREFLSRASPMSLVRAAMDDPRAACDRLWPQLAEMGWLGLTIPAAHGGAELGLVELSILLQECGRTLLPAPLYTTVALGTQAVLLAGSPAQHERWLPAIAEGTLKVTLAHLEQSAGWSESGVAMSAAESADGFTLSGTKLFVPDAGLADRLVVSARTNGGITLFVVDASVDGVTIRPLDFVDGVRKLSEVRFDSVRVAQDAMLGAIDGGWPVLERLFDFAKVALCAEMCGAAERVMEMAVDYAKVREQFGKPIGSFQAIQHKCADMLVAVESAKSATYYAAWALANGEPDAHTSACLAKAYVSEAFTKVAGDGIQVHGGIGFTWEQDLHLYFKRAKACELAFGTPSWNRELAARVLLDRR